MAIIPNIPIILQNGTTADANQVMADFNAIFAAVNANAAQNGANSDITSLSGLTTPLSISQGGTGAATASGARDNLGITALLAALVLPPVGSLIIWPTSSAPSNFLECNGQALSRTTYAALFAAIGTVYGAGDGSTTFNIPDLRGYFVRGWDNGRGVDSGRAIGSNQTSEVGPHSHTVTDPGHNHDPRLGSASLLGGPNALPIFDNLPSPDVTGTSTTGVTVDTSTGVESRPVNVAMMFCIRTV